MHGPVLSETKFRFMRTFSSTQQIGKPNTPPVSSPPLSWGDDFKRSRHARSYPEPVRALSSPATRNRRVNDVPGPQNDARVVCGQSFSQCNGTLPALGPHRLAKGTQPLPDGLHCCNQASWPFDNLPLSICRIIVREIAEHAGDDLMGSLVPRITKSWDEVDRRPTRALPNMPIWRDVRIVVA
jgi:hypothetical protein